MQEQAVQGQSAGAGLSLLLNLLLPTERYRKFSKMDEALFRLMVVSVGRGKEAVRYGWELICNDPPSEYVPKTFERLNEIGLTSWQGCEKFKR